MSSLSHHGIKGQRWGVRRFQNADGTRTAAGKKRYSVEAVDVNSSRKEVKKLVKGFSRKDKEFFFGRRYWDDEYDKGSAEEEAYFGVKKRFVIREGKDIVAFIDAQQTSEWDSELNMVIGTKASARGKGYASALAEKMVDWYDSEGYKSHEGLRWQAANENTGSRKIAEKTGFKQIDDDGLFDDEAVYAYSKNGKRELDKLAKEYANKKSVGKEVKDKINSDFKTTRISKLNPTTEIEPYGWVRSNKGESEWSRMKANLVDSYAERWVKKKYSDDLSRYDEAASSYGKARSNYYKKRKAQHTAIGGTMYIEGNALILGDSSYLEHHGIKGQRWGVRRFQNKDGTRTAAGKKRDAENLRSSQEATNVNSKIRSHINKQLSAEDSDTGKSNFDFASDLIKDPDFEKVIMPVVQDIRQTKAKYGNKEPYEFTGDEHQAYMNDIDRLDKKTGELAIAIGLAEKGEPNKKSTPPEGEYERVDMFRYALARYLDEHSPDGYSDEGDWIYHTSIGGTMYIEGNALILGDSSYLSHHGIRGQRWGVRRFQNADGSLTNAGRKRLGYATKGATQAVKKAFNAGVKTGTKAVKAAKAHHEKAEAKKIEKKKEKASKTRAGVYANKDLFTAKELKELNSKFEEQDKLLKARMEKGVEIAKAVGEYAKTAKQIGDAYQSITGKNILTHLTEIKEANETKAKEAKDAADKAKAEEDAAAKKAESKSMAKEALQKNIDAFKADQESNERVKDLEKQGNKTAAKVKLAEYIDRYNQDQAAQEATKQMMKNQKLQEYIDRANQAQREKDSATLKETTDRGKQVIDLLQRHSTDSDLFKEDYQNRMANTGNSTKPSSAPDDSNLMSLVRKANASNSLSTNSTSRSKDSDDLMAKNREAKAAGDIKDASERASKAIDLLGRKDRITNGNPNDDKSTSVSTPSMNDLAKLIRAANSANSKSGPTIEKSQWQRDLEERTRQLKSDDDNRKLANNLDSIKKAASDASKAANSKSNDPSETTQKLLANNAKKIDNGNHEFASVFNKALTKKEQRAPNLQKLEAAQKKWKSSSDPSLRKKYMKIVSEELQYLSDDEFDLYMAGKLFKHSAFSDPNVIEHYGVRGMKWGKHLMAGKGGNIYDGTALGAGGGGGPMTEEERKKAEELRKKKLEEAKKKAEEAAKEKQIEEKAKEIGVSAKAYKNYSIDKNHLPGKHHYDKSQKLHGEASSSVAEARAAERQAHMNRAKAASLNRKVNSSHMFDSQGYHISQQRGDDRKEAKKLQKEAKQLDAKSKKALKKFYKKRYRSDKERQKWQNSTSGKYHNMMRHYEIQNGVLFIDSFDGLAHHGVKGQRWGVRRFQNEDGTLTAAGRKHYEKALAKEKRKQVSSDAIRGTLERQHPFAIAASVALGATYAAMLGMASAAAPGAVVAGAAIAAVISGVGTHGIYSVSEAWEGRGTRMRSKKIAKYESMLKQSSMEEGMYHVENGTLFIDAGEPYLEHHGVLGMKWGKHLRAGKGPVDGEAGAGGGAGEDDEKLKEMAKKAGMSVAEYRTKMASKIGGAASKVGEAAYNAAGGSHKKSAEEYQKLSRDASNEARKYEASGNADLAKAASARRKGNTPAHSSYKTTGDNAKDEARRARERASALSEGARQEQTAYEKSLAGRYDKMKADRERKRKMKRRKMIEDAFRTKHSDDTDAIYTEGTRLVIASKWG